VFFSKHQTHSLLSEQRSHFPAREQQLGSVEVHPADFSTQLLLSKHQLQSGLRPQSPQLSREEQQAWSGSLHVEALLMRTENKKEEEEEEEWVSCSFRLPCDFVIQSPPPSRHQVQFLELQSPQPVELVIAEQHCGSVFEHPSVRDWHFGREESKSVGANMRGKRKGENREVVE
jgi:hypothetical protein